MNLFIFEYASAGGTQSEPFLEEGMAMLSSLIGDLKRLNSLHLTTMLQPDIAKRRDLFPADEIVEPAPDFQNGVMACMESADLLFIIAPETDGILHDLTKRGEELGKQIIGSTSLAVEILGDKLKTSEILKGVVTMPETKLFLGKADFSRSIIKPRFGAGSENIYISDGMNMPDLPDGDYIIQPLIDGDHLSAGFVASESSVRLLGVCRQKIKIGRRITFEGLEGPIEYHSPGLLTDMASAIQKKTPGLKGYFGFDFIDRREGVTLIEVNPRLTTSYPIYSANFNENLAGLLLESASVPTGEF